MAATHGSGAVVWLDSRAGTLTNVSTYVTNEDLSMQCDAAETTTFGDASEEYIPGLKDGTFSLSGDWSAAADAFFGLIRGKSGSFEIGPEGGGTGDVKYSGEAICTDFSTSHPHDGAATWSASFQITGDVSRGTFS